MGHNLLDFHLNLFGIDRTIPSSNANDSFAFQSFAISWNLNLGYKTKVITLTPKRSTITSNEEKEMIKSVEIRNSNNTCSSRLKKLFFVKIYVYGRKMRFLQSMKVKFVKKIQNFTQRLFYWLKRSIQNFRAIYPQIKLSPVKIFYNSKYIYSTNNYIYDTSCHVNYKGHVLHVKLSKLFI